MTLYPDGYHEIVFEDVDVRKATLTGKAAQLVRRRVCARRAVGCVLVKLMQQVVLTDNHNGPFWSSALHVLFCWEPSAGGRTGRYLVARRRPQSMMHLGRVIGLETGITRRCSDRQ